MEEYFRQGSCLGPPYRPAITKNRPQLFEVVGVAEDVPNDLLMNKEHPAVYFPLQPADFLGSPSLQGVTLMVRWLRH